MLYLSCALFPKLMGADLSFYVLVLVILRFYINEDDRLVFGVSTDCSVKIESSDSSLIVSSYWLWKSLLMYVEPRLNVLSIFL